MIANELVDNKIVNNGHDDPQMITLRTTGGTGVANIGFRMTNTSQLSQRVRGLFTILFE